MLTLAPHVPQDVSGAPVSTSADGYARFGQLVLASRAAHVIFAANALGVFQATEGGRTVAEIAHTAGTELRATAILLDALCALGWLQKTHQRYDNTLWGRETFVPTGKCSLGHNAVYQALTGESWAHLPRIVQSGSPVSTYGDLIRAYPAFLHAYMAAMDEIARQPAQHLATQMDLTEVQTMLDVGAGPGTFSRTFVEHAPQLHATLLDLPATMAQLEPFFAGWPHRDRVTLYPGDYHTTAFGDEQYDLILLSHVTHNEGELTNQALCTNAYRALRPGGLVVVHDFMLAEDGTAPLFSALFAVHMLVLTPHGRVYTRQSYEMWLRTAGFRHLWVLPVCPGAVNASVAIVGTKMVTP
jgi:ubiquinone/menaquinone biosynthesis C-methylase UbiE